MVYLERLKQVALRQHAEHDFPDVLLQQVLALSADAGRAAGREALIAELTEQIENFDPYAGVGCFCEAYGAATIAATLKRLQEDSGG